MCARISVLILSSIFSFHFLSQLSNVVVNCLNPFFKVDCKSGRILNTDDFKFLARKVSSGTFVSFIVVSIPDSDLKWCQVCMRVFERSLLSTTVIEQLFHVVLFFYSVQGLSNFIVCV